MPQEEVYVVRIYRRETAGACGVVELVATGKSVSFQSLGELVSVLSGAPGKRRRAKRAQRKARARKPAAGAARDR
jgi:hypothetical protein